MVVYKTRDNGSRVVTGIDFYNLTVTGRITMTLNACRMDIHKIPCVLVANSSGDEIAGTLDASYFKGTGNRSGHEREYVVVRREAEKMSEKQMRVLGIIADHPTPKFNSDGEQEIVNTLSARDYKGVTAVALTKRDAELQEKEMKWCIGNGQVHDLRLSEKVGALNCMRDQQKILTLDTNGNEEDQDTVVRRLTPTECERLQGYPDGWTDIGDWTDSNGKIKKTTESARYKALGNSICLPFWQWLARRITAQYERDITMGSLFDGIGGFPYVFERCGATAVWASEIEEFPIAVTKLRFPEDES